MFNIPRCLLSRRMPIEHTGVLSTFFLMSNITRSLPLESLVYIYLRQFLLLSIPSDMWWAVAETRTTKREIGRISDRPKDENPFLRKICSFLQELSGVCTLPKVRPRSAVRQRSVFVYRGENRSHHHHFGFSPLERTRIPVLCFL